MSRGIVAGAALVASAALTLVACQVLLGVSDEDGTARLPSGPEAGPLDSCEHTAPPLAPQGASDGVDLPPAWFAMTTLEGLARADGKPVGFDLDGRCTGLALPTAFDGGSACSKLVVDDHGGIDNSAQAMFAALPSGYGKTTFDTFDALAKSGARTLLVYLARYNGQPNDPSVVVKIVPSEAMQTSSCDGGAPPAPATDAGGPQLAGCDTWSYAPAGLTPVDGGAIPTNVYEGFVSEGRLVVGTKGGVDLEIGTASLPIPVVGAVLVARFGDRPGPGGGSVRTLNGTIAGRVAPAGLLAALARNPGFCNAPSLDTLRRVVCDYRDMPQSLADDPLRPCTHVSIGLAFQSVQGKLGTAAAAAPPAAPCAVPIPSCE